MDFQNRVGNKFGGGETSRNDEAINRRERLRKLALETIDINKVCSPSLPRRTSEPIWSVLWSRLHGLGCVRDPSYATDPFGRYPVLCHPKLTFLARETLLTLRQDPYFMRNHLGSYECKLCLTLHNNEGSYLAHTQGKKHQSNLAKRAAKEAQEAQSLPQPLQQRVSVKQFIKIGRPGYKVLTTIGG